MLFNRSRYLPSKSFVEFLFNVPLHAAISQSSPTICFEHVSCYATYPSFAITIKCKIFIRRIKMSFDSVFKQSLYEALKYPTLEFNIIVASL